ncbi:MAG TPA: MoaD/ThiS family protein [Jatrophihabitans sp.]|nr:MoaD/ThiS family protein [Jatrophihabitans sp.]
MQPPQSSASTGPVTVRYWAGARRVAGRDSERVHAADVAGLLAQLSDRSPALARVLAASSILVDTVASTPGQRLQPGAVVDVLPPFAGG